MKDMFAGYLCVRCRQKMQVSTIITIITILSMKIMSDDNSKEEMKLKMNCAYGK